MITRWLAAPLCTERRSARSILGEGALCANRGVAQRQRSTPSPLATVNRRTNAACVINTHTIAGLELTTQPFFREIVRFWKLTKTILVGQFGTYWHALCYF